MLAPHTARSVVRRDRGERWQTSLVGPAAAHVRYTSVKEYRHKRCVRGEANTSPKGCDVRTGRLSTAEDAKRGDVPDHIVHRPGLVFDDGAWRLLTRSVPRYRTYDEAGWEDYF